MCDLCVCVCVCVRVCVCVCDTLERWPNHLIYEYVYRHTHTHTNARTRTHWQTCTRARVHAHTHTHSNTKSKSVWNKWKKLDFWSTRGKGHQDDDQQYTCIRREIQGLSNMRVSFVSRIRLLEASSGFFVFGERVSLSIILKQNEAQSARAESTHKGDN